MDVLIIGGTGYIGKIVTELLLERSDNVTIFSRGSSRPHWWSQIEHITGDREDKSGFARSLKGKRFDCVIDTQAFKKEDVESVVDIFQGNTGRYFLVSTGSVYLEGGVDFLNNCPYNEDSVDWSTIDYRYPDELDTYAIGKRHCEKWINENCSIPYTIVRIPAVMGEGDPTGRIWWWIQRARDGGDLILPPQSLGSFRTIYSGDAARNFIRILDNPATINQTYYVAMPEIMDLNRWSNSIWNCMGSECSVAYIPLDIVRKEPNLQGYFPPMGRPFNNIHDLSKSEDAFGIVTQPFDQWIKSVVDWYADNSPIESSAGYGFRSDELNLVNRWKNHWDMFI